MGTLQSHLLECGCRHDYVWISEKELFHVRLESGGHLLQMSTREEFSQAEIVPVIVLMEVSLSRPAP
ncbi:MAG: hypothetical protein PVS3B1_24640 [Ktedonobacteraceae bacterium]